MTKKSFETAITPYPYQQLAIDAALKGLCGRSRRALVVLATGLGKTLTSAFTAKGFQSKSKKKKIRTLFLVHNNFILEHAKDEFGLVFDSEQFQMVMYNGLSKEGAAEADLVFATWQTMSRSLKQWARDHFDLVVVDEAHHTEAKTYKPVMNHFTGAKLGITATPDREDEADIRKIFGEEVIIITLEEAIAKGYLPPIEYHVVTDESLDDQALQEIVAEIKRDHRRFTMAEVNRRIFIRKRDQEIARIINGYREKAVVFCASIDHAERMKASLKRSGTFHSQKGSNQQDTWYRNQVVLECLNDGTLLRVCAVNAFNEGVNVPSVGLVAFCRVTDTVTVFRQQLGRGLRPGKDKLVVLDFVGNLERIRLILEMVEKIKGFSPSRDSQDRHTSEKLLVSGAGFQFTFSDKVEDLLEVLRHVEQEFYPTWQEAGRVVRNLGIGTTREYDKRYKEDNRLPSNPNQFYSNFPGWSKFLRDEEKCELYPTWQQASEAAKMLGISSSTEYTKNKRYKEDKRLPADLRAYSDFPGWKVFLDTEIYPTWQQASEAAKMLGISSSTEYLVEHLYKEDSRLPSDPPSRYSDFPGWPKFLRGEEKKELYPTWQQASEAAKMLGISSSVEYTNKQRYKEDLLLPSAPPAFYSDFPGWTMFLKGEAKKELYLTWDEAAQAIRRLGIQSSVEYRKRYKEDGKLPASLNNFYKDFPGWPKFLGKQ